MKNALKFDMIELKSNPRKVLHDAILAKDLPLFEELLQWDEIQQLINDDYTLSFLKLATGQNSKSIVERMIRIPSVYRYLTSENNQVEHWKNEDGSYGWVARMRGIPEKSSFMSELNFDLFQCAVFNDYREMLDSLLAIPAFQKLPTEKLVAALILAIQNDNESLALKLLEIPSIRNAAAYDDNIVLHEAIKSGHLNLIRKLFQIEAVQTRLENNPIKLMRTYNKIAILMEKCDPIPFTTNKDGSRVYQTRTLTSAEQQRVAYLRRLWGDIEIQDRLNSIKTERPTLDVWHPINLDRFETLFKASTPQSSHADTSHSTATVALQPQSSYFRNATNWCRTLFMEQSASPFSDDPDSSEASKPSTSSKRPRRN